MHAPYTCVYVNKIWCLWMCVSIGEEMVPSCFFLIKFLAKSKQMTRKPTPAAPPTIIATVFPVAPVNFYSFLASIFLYDIKCSWTHYNIINKIHLYLKKIISGRPFLMNKTSYGYKVYNESITNKELLIEQPILLGNIENSKVSLLPI